MIKNSILSFSFLLGSIMLFGQKDFKNTSENFSAIHVNYGAFVPSGDYDEYFGFHHQIGGAYSYKTKSNFIFSFDGNFIFGNQVDSQGMLKHLRTEDNNVLDEDGQLSTILFLQRGYSFFATAGKMLPILNRNPNSGLTFSLGLGYLSHKVRVEHQNNRIYALDGAYEKGYDRKTTGFALSQQITYRHHSDNKLANFSIGVAAYQAFTKNRRLYNFDLGGPDNRSRVDLSFGVTIGWIIPMYTRMASEYFYD